MSIRPRGRTLAVCAIAAAAVFLAPATRIQAQHRHTTITATGLSDLRAWSSETDAMLRSGELRMRNVRPDTLIPGRTIERADQYYKGVRVFGADVARQVDNGVVLSVFGNLYPDVNIDTTPKLSIEEARAKVISLAGVDQGIARQPELTVLPMDDGTYRLTWRMQAFTKALDVVQYFLDASTGEVVLQFSNRQTQSAVGRATGVLGDSKKISVSAEGGTYGADDLLRPPRIITYDMKGDPYHLIQLFDGFLPLAQSDVAADSDNVWTDGANVDAHVYAGYTYDFYYKTFGRHGLDNADISIRSFTHPVRRQDLFTLYQQFPDLFLNAGYYGNGLMLYGEGLPPGIVLTNGQTVDYFSAALDIVAHELTHGVTDYSSQLIYRNESGALNEAFSDMMGTSVEFMFQPAGDGLRKADYLLGEDVFRPGGTRSMANPGAFGDPDNYSKRYTGTEDNGGVHTNSGIANQAFYLAIEGGTNRTSGKSVQGVGGANREQIEKVFYRAFTQLLPSNATFSVARAATIQAARDLYGSGSSAERAVTDAWTAVGVK